jgi:hypothetical protein
MWHWPASPPFVIYTMTGESKKVLCLIANDPVLWSPAAAEVGDDAELVIEARPARCA